MMATGRMPGMWNQLHHMRYIRLIRPCDGQPARETGRDVVGMPLDLGGQREDVVIGELGPYEGPAELAGYEMPASARAARIPAQIAAEEDPGRGRAGCRFRQRSRMPARLRHPHLGRRSRASSSTMR